MGSRQGATGGSHHSAMLVRRSNSSAILPLRKHLIEKTLQDRTLDDMASGFYFSSSSLSAAAATPSSSAGADGLATSSSVIRPIEEVMEEDGKRPTMEQPSSAGTYRL